MIPARRTLRRPGGAASGGLAPGNGGCRRSSLGGNQQVEDDNRFLRAQWIGRINPKSSVPAAQDGHEIVPVQGHDLDCIFSIQHEWTVGKDGTMQLADLFWQIQRTPWRGTHDAKAVYMSARDTLS